ncbi:MAG TPA: LapA family protein [Candidatus Saccharimonadales bacterium]|nr:LapA family protein [Candidatus Saccharimonadales bacterium]
MIALTLALLIGIVFSFFAIQNNQPVSLQIQNFTFTDIPLYLVTLASMLVGIVLSLIVTFADSISHAIGDFGKDREIKNASHSLEKLENKVHNLEVENARLKGNHYAPTFEKSQFDKPNAIQRIRNRLSV